MHKQRQAKNENIVEQNNIDNKKRLTDSTEVYASSPTVELEQGDR